MRCLACLLFICLTCFSVQSQSVFKHGRLQVASNSHYLQYADGTPFFWLGDTGWELFHRLKLEEIKTYLDNRAAKGFTVIQAVALAEFKGLTRPNRYGELPLKNLDPNQPNNKYFAVIDSTLKMAERRNLFIGLLPTWGDKVLKLWGDGPEIFDTANAYTYGKWLGNRYKNNPNIIWILGGDRPAEKDGKDYRPVWRAMAKGIIDATHHQCIIAYHPSGSKSTSEWLQQESWLDINMFQSGHGEGHDVACWAYVKHDRNLLPAKPTLDAEPNYEDHPVNPWPKWNTDSGYYRDYDVRKQIYRSVFAGACGVTYGHHAVWQFMSEREEVVNYPDRGWVNAIDRPGAFQAGYLRQLMQSRPMNKRIPDSTIIVTGQGLKGYHMEAFRAADSSYGMVYIPVGTTVTINTSFLKGAAINACWFNPRNNTTQKIELSKRTAQMSFTTPTTGLQNDWVLVIDDAKAQYKMPGK